MDSFSLIILPAFIAGLLSFFMTPAMIAIAWRLGIVDDPQKNKSPKTIHTYPVPRGGGVPIFLSILTVTILFLPFDKHLKGIIAGAALLVVIGLLDDRYNLNPYLRLAFQFIAASMPIIAGIGIAFISGPFGKTIDLSQSRIFFNLFGQTHSIWVFADLFALFWIVLITNFVNMGAKGVDGQLSGTVGIAALVIALLSFKFSADITEWPVTILASITAGAFFGFLPWHIYPQKIMPSFSGSNLAGYLLAVLAILTTTKVGTVIIVLAVPLIDTGYTIVRRILSGKSPVWGDRGHLHHKLLDLGLSKWQIASIYWLASGILGILALHLNATNKLYTIVGVAIFIGNFLLWITYRLKS